MGAINPTYLAAFDIRRVVWDERDFDATICEQGVLKSAFFSCILDMRHCLIGERYWLDDYGVGVLLLLTQLSY